MTASRPHPSLTVDPADQAEVTKVLQSQAFVVRPTSTGALSVMPDWVYRRSTAPSIFKIVASCPASDDIESLCKLIQGATDYEFEASLDSWSDERAEIASADPIAVADLPATVFYKWNRRLGSSRAAILDSAFRQLILDLKAIPGIERFVAVGIDVREIGKWDSTCRILPAIERWGWRATKEGVEARRGSSAAGITVSMLSLSESLLDSALNCAPHVRAMVFSRFSIALVALFHDHLLYEELEGSQKSIEQVAAERPGPLGCIDRLQRATVGGASDAEEYLRWYLARLNDLYGQLRNSCNCAARPNPFSEQARAWNTVNISVHDVSRIRVTRDAYVAKRLAFTCFDKLANVVSRDSGDDTRIAKSLLTQNVFRQYVDPALAKIPTALGRGDRGAVWYRHPEKASGRSLELRSLPQHAKRYH